MHLIEDSKLVFLKCIFIHEDASSFFLQKQSNQISAFSHQKWRNHDSHIGLNVWHEGGIWVSTLAFGDAQRSQVTCAIGIANSLNCTDSRFVRFVTPFWGVEAWANFNPTGDVRAQHWCSFERVSYRLFSCWWTWTMTDSSEMSTASDDRALERSPLLFYNQPLLS